MSSEATADCLSPPPSTQPKFDTNDYILLTNVHESLHTFRFRVVAQIYDRAQNIWRYKVSNAQVLGQDQYMTVREDNMTKPEYEVGQEYLARDQTGHMVKGTVIGMRIRDGGIEYEVSVTHKPITLTVVSAEAMSRDFWPRARWKA